MPPSSVTERDPAPQTRRQRRNRFRGDIEGLRAVAVLLVVAFHAGVGVVRGGFVGVDVFFVLSGFLITGLLVDEVARTGTISLGDFYARRIRRLLPLSTLVLAATAVATVLLVPPIDRKGIAGDLAGAALWGANWRFAAESTQYMADTDKSPVLHYWSLSVEEQFYVVWPLLLLLLVGRSGLAQRAWSVALRRMTVALALLVAGSLFLSWQLTAGGSAFAYFGLHTRAWELGVGAALALARPLLPLLTRRAAQVGAAVGLLMVVGSALLMDEMTPFPGTAALVPVLGTALLVAAGARLPEGGVALALSHPVPRYIGRVSYAWYLWHWPVLVLAQTRFGTPTPTGTDTALWVVVAAVALSFALAVLSHYVVEQPARSLAVLKDSRRRTLLAGGALVGVALVASSGLALGSSVSEESVVEAPRGSGRTAAGDVYPTRPEDARKDAPAVDGCYNGHGGAQVPPAAECRVGPADGGTRTIALVGDSHATSWRAAMTSAAKTHGWTVYFFGKASCSVNDVPLWLDQKKTEYESCAQWRETVIERLASIEHLDAVVVGRYKDYDSRVLLPDGSRTTEETVGPVWREGAERSFARLREVAPHVLVLRDVPWPDQDVPSCLSRHPQDVERCSFERATNAHQDQVLFEAERTAAAGSKGIGFIDMTDAICPTPRCQVVTAEGRIIYRDAHHLTEGFSSSQGTALAQHIEAAL